MIAEMRHHDKRSYGADCGASGDVYMPIEASERLVRLVGTLAVQRLSTPDAISCLPTHRDHREPLIVLHNDNLHNVRSCRPLSIGFASDVTLLRLPKLGGRRHLSR